MIEIFYNILDRVKRKVTYLVIRRLYLTPQFYCGIWRVIYGKRAIIYRGSIFIIY